MSEGTVCQNTISAGYTRQEGFILCSLRRVVSQTRQLFLQLSCLFLCTAPYRGIMPLRQRMRRTAGRRRLFPYSMHEQVQRKFFIYREVITLQLKQNKDFKIFLKYLIPCMLSMALMAVYTFTDTFVVGRKLGAIALGAMGICTPVLTVTYALGFLYGMGGGVLYSIDKGKKDTNHANKIFTTSFMMLLVTGLLIMAAGNLFIWPLSHFLGADKENIAYVIPYLRCIVSYAPGFMLDVFLMTYIKNDGHPNVAMVATVTGIVLNIILDCIFVFIFKWGMFGAAFATCIGSGSCSAISIFYILKKRLNLIPCIKNMCGNLILRILQAGFSVFVLECSSGIVTFVFIFQATKFYGTIGASIYMVIMNLLVVKLLQSWAFLYMTKKCRILRNAK